MERERNYIIIYPEYFDYRLSRRLGRKLPLSMCLKNPTIEELAEALKKLKIPYVVEDDKSHPANWFERKGRIRVNFIGKKYKKTVILKAIAKNLKDVRKKILQRKQLEAVKKRKEKRDQVSKFVERSLKKKSKSKR